MAAPPPPPAKHKPADIQTLIDLTKTTQTLLSHYQSSLLPSKKSSLQTPTPPSSSSSTTNLPNPLSVLKATTTLLRSHTTTLSLLLITPPLTPSALITKIQDVSSSVLGGMVAAALYMPSGGERDTVGNVMRAEVKSQVWRLLGTWGDVLGLVVGRAEGVGGVRGGGKRKDSKKKDAGPSEQEKQSVLAATGVVWDACDTLVKLCDNGVVGLVVKKAEEWRAVLLDALSELKEWGEDVVDDDDDDDENNDEGGSADEEEDDLAIFGPEKKLHKSDEEMKTLLDRSAKKLKMMGMLYQAVVKRRLKTFPLESSSSSTSSSSTTTTTTTTTPNGIHTLTTNPSVKLDTLMARLKSIPDTVDDLASAFYDLHREEARETLDKCCAQAKSVVQLVAQNWSGVDDEFTLWSEKWVGALDGV